MSDTGTTTTATDPRDVEPVPGDAFGDWYSYNGKEYDTLAEAWCDYYEHCNARLRMECDEAIALLRDIRDWLDECATTSDMGVIYPRIAALLQKHTVSPAGSRAEGSGT